MRSTASVWNSPKGIFLLKIHLIKFEQKQVRSECSEELNFSSEELNSLPTRHAVPLLLVLLSHLRLCCIWYLPLERWWMFLLLLASVRTEFFRPQNYRKNFPSVLWLYNRRIFQSGIPSMSVSPTTSNRFTISYAGASTGTTHLSLWHAPFS